jgi:hypothetical protein
MPDLVVGSCLQVRSCTAAASQGPSHDSPAKLLTRNAQARRVAWWQRQGRCRTRSSPGPWSGAAPVACRQPPPPTPACPCSRAAGGLQTPADAALLAKRGVTTVFCLQEDSDLAYFSIDIAGIQAACE